jgi:hypothetical protein
MRIDAIATNVLGIRIALFTPVLCSHPTVTVSAEPVMLRLMLVGMSAGRGPVGEASSVFMVFVAHA